MSIASNEDHFSCLFGDHRGKTFINSFLNYIGPLTPRADGPFIPIQKSNDKYYASYLFNKTSAVNMMRSKYYTNIDETVDGVQITENDIHYEFMNLVNLLAIRLRELDKSAEEGTKLLPIMEHVRKVMNMFKEDLYNCLTGDGDDFEVCRNHNAKVVGIMLQPANLYEQVIRDRGNLNDYKKKLADDLIDKMDSFIKNYLDLMKNN